MEYYFWQEILDNEEEQKRGIVLVLCLFNVVQNANDPMEKDIVEKLVDSVPGRFTAIHLLLPDRPLYHCIKATYTLLFGKKNRNHMRMHVGSTTEILYSLKAFGIPVELLPQNLKRDCRQALIKHNVWVDQLEAKDAARMNGHDFDQNPVYDCPMRKDILLGKGRQIMKHPGNKDLRHLLEEKIHLWEAATNQEKAQLARDLVREICATGSRFLRAEEKGWFVEVDEDTARQKVSIGFRDTVKRRKRNAVETEASPSPYQPVIPYATAAAGLPSQALSTASGQSEMQTLDSDTFQFSGMSDASFQKRRRLSDSSCECFGAANDPENRQSNPDQSNPDQLDFEPV